MTSPSTSRHLSATSALPSTPTPHRTLTSTLLTPSRTPGLTPSTTTPSTTLRYPTSLSSHHSSTNEDPLVIEVGSRFLRAGFSNELAPRCVIPWHRGMFKRAGDKVKMGDLVTGGGNGGKREGVVLWEMDVRGVEVGLVEDLVERGVREAYHKYLLLDPKTRRLLVPLPPLLPHPLLTSLLHTLFTHPSPPSITLLPSPLLSTISAGLRHSLTINISFHETLITPIYDLRLYTPGPIPTSGRSRRGAKLLRQRWMELLERYYKDQYPASTTASTPLSIDDVEEAMERLSWCRSSSTSTSISPTLLERPISIPLTTTGTVLTLPFASLATPAEETFFSPTTHPDVWDTHPDDDDLPLHEMMYRVLELCGRDVRAAVLGRIVFVGGGSEVKGLKERAVEELKRLIAERGFRTPTRKRGAEESKRASTVVSSEEGFDWGKEIEGYEKPLQGGKKDGEGLAGEVKAVKSLGVWAGASLVGGLKVKGKEVEREKFLAAVARGESGLPAGLW